MWFGFEEASRKTCSALKHAQQGLTMMQHVHKAFNLLTIRGVWWKLWTTSCRNSMKNQVEGGHQVYMHHVTFYDTAPDSSQLPTPPPKSLIEATEEHFCQRYLWRCTTHHFPGAILALSLTVESHCISEGWCLNFFLIWQTWNWRSSRQWTFNW